MSHHRLHRVAETIGIVAEKLFITLPFAAYMSAMIFAHRFRKSAG